MLQMENMVSEVIQGTLMESDGAVDGRKAVGEKVQAFHIAGYAVKRTTKDITLMDILIILPYV